MSVNVDYTQWRLATPAGTKYKLYEGTPTGSIQMGGAQVQEKWIIRAQDLLVLATECWPSTILWPGGVWSYEPYMECPRFPGFGLFATKMDFGPLVESKPVDPESSDPTAPEKTYGQFLVVTIDFSPLKVPSSPGDDPNDPETFAEYSASASAEFLSVEPGITGYWEASADTWDYWNGDIIPTGDLYQVGKDVNIPKSVPHTEWSIKFPRIGRDVLPIVLETVRGKLGKVNSSTMNSLGEAPPETVLFTSLSIREELLIGTYSQPPFELELKFDEKNVYEDGQTKGHNHLYNKDSGKFDRVWIGSTSTTDVPLVPLYQSINLNNLLS